MAADPIAAATALAGKTYSGAQERTAATQKALLDNLAANGTYQGTVNQAATTAAAPAPAAPAPASQAGNAAYPQIAAIANQGATNVSTMGQAALAAATALAAHQAQSQANSATTYFQQAAAAMPLEQSRAASQAQQTMADLTAQREAQAAAKEQAAIQLQISRNSLAAQQAAKSGALSDPTKRFALQQSMQAAATDAAIPSKYATHTLDPNTGQAVLGLDRRGQAIQDVIAGMSVHDAAVKNGLDPATRSAEIAQQAQVYYNTLEQSGYYSALGGTKPIISAAAPVNPYEMGPPVTHPELLGGLSRFAGATAGASAPRYPSNVV